MIIPLFAVACNAEGIKIDTAAEGQRDGRVSASQDRTNTDSDSQTASGALAGSRKSKAKEGSEADLSGLSGENSGMHPQIASGDDKAAVGKPASQLPPQAAPNAPAGHGNVTVTAKDTPTAVRRNSKASATFLVTVPDQEVRGLFTTFELKGEACTMPNCGSTLLELVPRSVPLTQRLNVDTQSVFPKGNNQVVFTYDVPPHILKDGKLNICFKAFKDTERKNAVSENICWDAQVTP